MSVREEVYQSPPPAGKGRTLASLQQNSQFSTPKNMLSALMVKALSTSPAGVSCRQSTCSCRQSMCSCRQSTCLMPSVNVFMPAASSLRSLRGVVWDLQCALYRTEINVSCGYHQLDRSRSPKMHCILLVYSPLRRLGQLTLHSASIQPVEMTRSAHTAFC